MNRKRQNHRSGIFYSLSQGPINGKVLQSESPSQAKKSSQKRKEERLLRPVALPCDTAWVNNSQLCAPSLPFPCDLSHGRDYYFQPIKMSSLRHAARSSTSSALRTPSLASSSHGRSPAYRRIVSGLERHNGASPSASFTTTPPALAALRSPFLPQTIANTQLRGFHQSSTWLQDQPKTEAKPAAKPEAQPDAKAEQKPADAEAGAKAESEEQAKKEDGEEKSEDGEKKQEKKEDLPPPPPHGDKTPWQVFMETMQTEFKQNKEWNDSTKQLAAGAKELSESENVRRAREAYESTTGAISSTTGKVLKTTGTAIGKGAGWAWDTSVMKGVRKGANATGDVLDKATKPLRETEAYKNVKNVIDDGSSSRYGGWVEKEERRKAKELREKQAAELYGKPEDMVEDPKYETLPSI